MRNAYDVCYSILSPYNLIWMLDIIRLSTSDVDALWLKRLLAIKFAIKV
jgi:hypothetical protein